MFPIIWCIRQIPVSLRDDDDDWRPLAIPLLRVFVPGGGGGGGGSRGHRSAVAAGAFMCN